MQTPHEVMVAALDPALRNGLAEHRAGIIAKRLEVAGYSIVPKARTAWSHDLEAIPPDGFVLASYGDCEGPEVWDAAHLRNCLFGENLSPQMKSMADQAAEVQAWALIPE